MQPNELYQFMLEALGNDSKLRIIEEDMANLRFRFTMLDKYQRQTNFGLAISDEGNFCNLHFIPATEADSPTLASAVASLVKVIVQTWKTERAIEYGTFPVVMDNELERVATYLEKHPFVPIGQIVDALGMTLLAASVSLHRLMDKRIVGCTLETPCKFFLK